LSVSERFTVSFFSFRSTSSRARLNRAQSDLRKINRRIDVVRKSDQDGELKRQQVDRLRAIKNQIQRALGEKVLEARAS
jgi:hypothetical protein